MQRPRDEGQRDADHGVARRRPDCPPVEPRRTKGSKEDVLSLARDEDALGTAVENFRKVIYAPSSTAGKCTRSRLWQEFAEALSIEEYPLTPDKVTVFAAALRDAGPLTSSPSYPPR